MSKEFKPHSHIPYGSDGSGFYSDHVDGCYLVIEKASSIVQQAFENVPFKEHCNRPFTIADYGTADGGTSMQLISKIITWVKAKYSIEQEVLIRYEDQPTNDFKSLFLRLYGLKDSASYIQNYKGVFSTASGASFYSQCFPSGSEHLGFSSTAMHWLFQRPCTLKSCLHHTSSTNENEKQEFANEAGKNWELILVNRAKELAPGGHMVVANLGIDEKGQFLGSSHRVKESMFENMTKHWRRMMEEGIITQKEFEETTFNNYYRTVEETRAPFEEVTSSVYQAGLRLVSVTSHLIPCPYNLAWKQAKYSGKTDVDDRRKYAKEFIPTVRVWSNSTFLSALSNSRSEEEKLKAVDEFYQRYEDEIAECPDDHAMDYVHVYVHFRKEI